MDNIFSISGEKIDASEEDTDYLMFKDSDQLKEMLCKMVDNLDDVRKISTFFYLFSYEDGKIHSNGQSGSVPEMLGLLEIVKSGIIDG